MHISSRSPLVHLAVGILIGILSFGTFRFARYAPPAHAHYHANFAVYINGQKSDFSAEKYMEPVSACTTESEQTPQQRVHLHNNKGDEIHVHAGNATWGDFFANLRFGIGASFLATDDARVLVPDADRNLVFILNGQKVVNPANRVIESGDRLLVSFGTESDDVVAGQFAEVANNAAELNVNPDPASCGGHSQKTTVSERFKSIFN